MATVDGENVVNDGAVVEHGGNRQIATQVCISCTYRLRPGNRRS